MVDALDSKSSILTDVRVRVSPPAFNDFKCLITIALAPLGVSSLRGTRMVTLRGEIGLLRVLLVPHAYSHLLFALLLSQPHRG